MPVVSKEHPTHFRSLMRINLVVTGVASSVAFILHLINNVDLENAMIRSVMGVITMLLVGTVNIFILDFKGANTNFLRPDKQKVLRYLMSYTASAMIYIITFEFFRPLITHGRPGLPMFSVFAVLVIASWVQNTMTIVFYNYYSLQQSKTHSEIENLKLKAAVSETANQVLKQQIHPHFLFNVLNTVKSLYKQDLQQGEAYLVHLANFLRASLSNPTARIVRLEDELQLCFDYIEMQRIRFGTALTYRIDLTSEIRNQKFVPYFAVQTLLENAIKHNDLTEEAPLHIEIIKEADCLKVINTLQPRHFKEPSTGQGLSNLAERYRLLAGEEIHIEQNENQFSVRIKLLDNEDSHH